MTDAPVSSIRNLGAASDALYACAGLTSAAQVRTLGADASYLRLLAAGQRPHFIAYYALVLGLQGRLWTDLPAGEKAVLRRRFDALKAEAAALPSAADGRETHDKGRARLDAALDALGVIAPGKVQPTSSRPEKK